MTLTLIDAQENVLISSNGRAVLTDFGRKQLLINVGAVVGTQSLQGSVRWSAPELLVLTDEAQTHECYTKASDVWAFGMVVYVRRVTILLEFD